MPRAVLHSASRVYSIGLWVVLKENMRSKFQVRISHKKRRKQIASKERKSTLMAPIRSTSTPAACRFSLWELGVRPAIN
jgi:hypothetical protein